MNRRHFLRTMLGAAIATSVAPSIFLPKIEPVRWKVPRFDDLTFASLNAQAKLWRQIAIQAELNNDYFKHFENFTWSPVWKLDAPGRPALIRLNA